MSSRASRSCWCCCCGRWCCVGWARASPIGSGWSFLSLQRRASCRRASRSCWSRHARSYGHREPASPIAPAPAVSARRHRRADRVDAIASVPALADVLVALWLLGAGALLVRSIVSTRRLAADPSVGPALVGVLRPRLVLPADFETRFDAQERALILAHEEVHRVSGHTVVNALVEVARCASWFNPLVHLAATRLRADQELACDAAVIAAHPSERRAYAQALLKSSTRARLPAARLHLDEPVGRASTRAHRDAGPAVTGPPRRRRRRRHCRGR